MKVLLCHTRYQQRGGEDEVFDAEERMLRVALPPDLGGPTPIIEPQALQALRLDRQIGFDLLGERLDRLDRVLVLLQGRRG